MRSLDVAIARMALKIPQMILITAIPVSVEGVARAGSAVLLQKIIENLSASL